MFKRVLSAFPLFILDVFLACTLFAATPQISGITGTIQSGRVITIAGQYLVDEDNTNWIDATSNGGPNFKSSAHYGFESASYDADADIFPGTPDQNNKRTLVYDTAVKLMGSKSIRGNDYGASNGNMLSTGFYLYTLGASEYYVRLYSRWNVTGTPAWPNLWSKFIDLPGSGEMWYWQPPASGSLPTMMNMRYNDTDHLSSVNNFMQQNRWYCMEARFKVSSPGNFTTWIDNRQIVSAAPTLGKGVHLGWILFNGPNYSGTNSDFNITVWADNLTVSTSRIYCSSIIEIGNGSDYNTATKVYQAPVFLSDSSVQFTLDLTGLGAGPYYLWVTNNRQIRSAAYPIEGGTPPNQPTGLHIINQ